VRSLPQADHHRKLNQIRRHRRPAFTSWSAARQLLKWFSHKLYTRATTMARGNFGCRGCRSRATANDRPSSPQGKVAARGLAQILPLEFIPMKSAI
jgi:hypothetical protein